MAAAGGAAGRRGPGRPCPFSIEHILSSLPERSPPARAARPPQPAGRQSPAESAEPGVQEAVPCACCCCFGPRATPRRSPEAAPGLGEWARSRRGARGRLTQGEASVRGSAPTGALLRLRPAGARLPWPLRLGPAAPSPLAAQSGGSGALPSAGGPGPQRRTRRHRTIFSEEQLQALEALFVQNQYPDVGTRERLAGRIRLREERVEVGARFLRYHGRPGPEHRPGTVGPSSVEGGDLVREKARTRGGDRGRRCVWEKCQRNWTGGKASFLCLYFNPAPFPDAKASICSCCRFWKTWKCLKLLQKGRPGLLWVEGGKGVPASTGAPCLSAADEGKKAQGFCFVLFCCF